MPSYNRYTVARLRELCDERSINCENLTNKRALIDALQQFDMTNDVIMEERETHVSNNDDNEIQLGEHLTNGAVQPVDGMLAGDDERESVETLKLKLALVKAEKDKIEREWEIERQRMEMHGEQRATNNVTFAQHRDVKGLLPVMSDDVLSFFMSYERVLILNNIDISLWAQYLTAQLSPKALKTFSRLSIEDSQNYETIKNAILADYNLGAQTYLKTFRTMKRHGVSNYVNHLSNMREVLHRYIDASGIVDFDMLVDSILREQFMLSLPSNVQAFVLAKEPACADDCAKYADLSFQVSRIGQNDVRQFSATSSHFGPQTAQLAPRNGGFNNRPPAGPFHGHGNHNRPIMQHRGGGGPRPMNAGGNRWRNPNQNFGRDRHAALFSRDCAINDVDCDDVGLMHETINTVDVKNDDLAYDNDATDCEYIIPLYLNNMSIHAIRDTGNLGPVLVSSDLISPDQLIPNKYTRLHGAFDRNRSHKVPMTYVELRSPLFNYDENVTVLAAVCELPAGIQCVIGNALFKQHPELTDIVSVRRKVCTNAKMNDTAQDTDSRAQSDTDRQVQNHTDTNGKINSSSELIEHTTSAEESNNSTVITELSDNRQTDVEQVDCEVTHVISDSRPASASDATEALDAVFTTKSAAAAVVTRAAAERSKLSDTHAGDKPVTDSARRAHGALTPELNDQDRTLTEFGRIDISALTDIPTKTDTNTTSTEFALEQKSDPALLDLWTKAQGSSSELCIIDGLLYRRTPSYVSSEHEFALVVPEKFQNAIIRIAHSAPMSGHFGIRKTQARIAALYHFPRMHAKIKHFIRSCEKCQMVAPIRRKERQPLQKLDVTANHAFYDISADIIGGQWPVTQKGNRYMLVTIDNVSKWVNIMPLRNLKAETIADAFIEIFSFTGLPKVIRSDNMPSFRSELMTAMYKKLGIEPRYSAPFHFISHGSVERVQGTIENVLRKFVQDNPRQWDRLIPYVLFALREIPQNSTGYSAAELVYGRKMRGLLQVIRETWTDHDPMREYSKMSTLDYMTKLNDKIAATLSVAKENMSQAQAKMKAYYDKSATVRELKPGDLALVLMPTSSNKLFAVWKGPFKVLKRHDNQNYELQMGHRKAMLHINSLRKFYPETNDKNGLNLMIVNGDDEDDDNGLTIGLTDINIPPAADAASDNESQLDLISLGQQLTSDQREALSNLLIKHKDVFADRPGLTNVITHKIQVTDETPCYQPSYRVPESLKDAVERELMKMVEYGIIQYDDETSWNSPLIVVRKKGEEKTFV